MKEKQIEEMAKILNRVCMEGGCSECPYHELRHEEYTCLDLNMASTLYNAGYRKASEVAREIIDDVKETLLDYHLQENKKYLNSQSKTKKQFDIETARYRAITDTVKFAIATLDELKNKYESEEGK